MEHLEGQRCQQLHKARIRFLADHSDELNEIESVRLAEIEGALAEAYGDLATIAATDGRDRGEHIYRVMAEIHAESRDELIATR